MSHFFHLRNIQVSTVQIDGELAVKLPKEAVELCQLGEEVELEFSARGILVKRPENSVSVDMPEASKQASGERPTTLSEVLFDDEDIEMLWV